MMEMVMTLANGNVVCALEGGYTLKTTSKGAVGCIAIMTVRLSGHHMLTNYREERLVK